MNKPAAIEGDYVDLRFMPGLKVARISIEIPIEYSAMFIEMFSTPNKVSPVKVVVARLAVGAYAPAESGPENAPGPGVSSPAAAVEAQDKPRTYTRSQIAALKVKDQSFQMWLLGPGAILRKKTRDEPNEVAFEREADRRLKERLGITSKRELDLDGPKAVAFDKLLTDFDLRGMVR